MKKTVGNLTVDDREERVYVYPASCEFYVKALANNFPRAMLLRGKHDWSGTAYECGKYSSDFSAKTKGGIVEKAVALVNQALEERKKS